MTVPDTPDNEHDPENAWSESIFTERTQEVPLFPPAHPRWLMERCRAVDAERNGTQLIICVNLRSFAAKKSMFGRSQFWWTPVGLLARPRERTVLKGLTQTKTKCQ